MTPSVFVSDQGDMRILEQTDPQGVRGPSSYHSMRLTSLRGELRPKKGC